METTIVYPNLGIKDIIKEKIILPAKKETSKDKEKKS